MMDKKSGNGFQTKASEGGGQRKQLPYSVETPYGFHLDLDFLKYVDDIEKGNTIKRVHIQRRVKGPPKFSTLPRNFSLPGHGAKPVSKEKESTWSGTSTLGPKPKSRVTEVQQIFDFRTNEMGSSSQSSKGSTSPGSSYVPTKPRDDISKVVRAVEEKAVELQGRPNLLRASSMPVTLQQRKGSDSSSPDRTVGTPENGSTENMFRPSPDITERRTVPQERTGLHHQITVALKRVRELEEQVKTIPELKAQICSLREEREQLLLQLKARAQEQISASRSQTTPASSAAAESQPGHRPTGGLNLVLNQPTGGAELSKAESQRLLQPSEKSDKPKEEDTVQRLPHDKARQGSPSPKPAVKHTETVSVKDSDAEKYRKSEDLESLQILQEKLMILEDKLTQASHELENTNSLLKEQIEENKVKEERILQLSEGMHVEICSTEAVSRSRRESIDTGTVTEKVSFANQETETELVVTIDQGTDTDKISVPVCVSKEGAASMDGVSEIKVEVPEHVNLLEAEAAAMSPPRPRANSMERGTVTERVATQDQMTETHVAPRVNQVTETEGETVTDHPHRRRANSVERGTVTERVDTVDRVTETEAAQRTDQQTETERLQDNNPTREAETQNEVGESVSRERVEGAEGIISDRVEESKAVGDEKVEDKKVKERIQRDGQKLVLDVVPITTAGVPESVNKEAAPSETVRQDKEKGLIDAKEEDKESLNEVKSAQNDLEAKEMIHPESEVMEKIGTKQTVVEKTEKKKIIKEESVCSTVTESINTDIVVISAVENEAEKTAAPVRPQRGRKASAEQVQPSPPQPQPQTEPVCPLKGSSEAQAQQPQTEPQPQEQIQRQAQHKAQTQTPPVEEQAKPPSVTPAEDKPQLKKTAEEKSQPQAETKGSTPGSRPVHARPKTIQAQSHSQTSARRDSKEFKAPQKASQSSSRRVIDSSSRPIRQGSSDVQTQVSRRSSGETQPHKKEATERRSSTETAQRRGSSEAQAAARKDSGEAQPLRRGSSESPTSPAALGQVVTRLTGLLGEQWAQLGSSSGGQQTAPQQEVPSTQRQVAGKRTEAGKGAAAKPTGKAAPAATTVKAAGKPAPSKMSSIQSQLVSSLSVLSAFYSPGQKAAAGKQQEQGLKSIMKKNGVADKQGNKGAKKNLKFVGVNGGSYESTSSEESSGDEKPKVDVEEEDSSEPEVEKVQETPAAGTTDEVQDQEKVQEVSTEEGGAAAEEMAVERGLMDPEYSQEDQDEQDKVDKGFIDACLYVRDRMEEVSSPDKEMRQVLVVLYQEWFKVSSQKDSQADTVRIYLRQVGMTTPTLLPYVVNLTDGNGNMALHYSVSHSNFPVVKLLLDTGLCETDNVNKAGYTPVMLAALTAAETPDDLEVAQQLLRLGDVNARSRQASQTALMLAVSHGRVAMVKLLLSCNADVNAQDREGSTALMCACEHGHTHIARLLLESGRCDTSLTDKNGQTALSVAEGAAHQDIIELLKTQISETPSRPDLL